MNFKKFSTFLGHFCPPGSGSGFRIRIRIHWPDWKRIRIRNPGLRPLLSSPLGFFSRYVFLVLHSLQFLFSPYLRSVIEAYSWLVITRLGPPVCCTCLIFNFSSPSSVPGPKLRYRIQVWTLAPYSCFPYFTRCPVISLSFRVHTAYFVHRRIFANAHTYHINSISVNSDQVQWVRIDNIYQQFCGTVTIFTVPVPTFDKLRLRFRFRLRRYPDHKRLIFQKIWKIFCLSTFTSSFFTRKKFKVSLNLLWNVIETNWKENEGNQYIILNLVPVPEPWLSGVLVPTF
jgi:hypothetical protein